MGQQQLLLVILVTIIVGIATVVAINTFGSAADSANEDAVRQDLAQIAASAQGFYIKPTQLGGGGRSFANVTFEGLAFPATFISADNLSADNANGRYNISSTAAGTFTVTAVPSSLEGYTAGAITAGVQTALSTGGSPTLQAVVTPNNLVISAVAAAAAAE